jgi:hypothetical protein
MSIALSYKIKKPPQGLEILGGLIWQLLDKSVHGILQHYQIYYRQLAVQ